MCGKNDPAVAEPAPPTNLPPGMHVKGTNIPEVGDYCIPADGSAYLGRVTLVSREDDTVKHQSERNGSGFAIGDEYAKSYWGFFTRYILVVPDEEKP